MTITINYGTEITKFETIKCDCSVTDYNGECIYCNGNGEYNINHLEMNVSNSNFIGLMEVLGIEVNLEYGQGTLIPAKIVSAIDDYFVLARYNGISLDEDYTCRRFTVLRNIAQAYVDAGKGDESIPWG